MTEPLPKAGAPKGSSPSSVKPVSGSGPTIAAETKEHLVSGTMVDKPADPQVLRQVSQAALLKASEQPADVYEKKILLMFEKLAEKDLKLSRNDFLWKFYLNHSNGKGLEADIQSLKEGKIDLKGFLGKLKVFFQDLANAVYQEVKKDKDKCKPILIDALSVFSPPLKPIDSAAVDKLISVAAEVH